MKFETNSRSPWLLTSASIVCDVDGRVGGPTAAIGQSLGTSERVPPYALLKYLDDLGLGAARRRWIDRALAIDMDDVTDLYERFPDGWISPGQWEFALAYMEETRQYLEEINQQ